MALAPPDAPEALAITATAEATDSRCSGVGAGAGCSPGRVVSLSAAFALFRERREPCCCPPCPFWWPPLPCADPFCGSWETSTPRPLQCSQVLENASSRPVPTRFRVICTRPSEVTSATWCRVRSRPRHSVSLRSTSSRLDSRTMSMKSMTMIPPMSRSRS